MNSAIGVVFLLFFQYKTASSDLESDLLQSMERAMQCLHRDPPEEPVMAMTPKRYSQLVALIRKNLDTPVCDKSQPPTYFNIHDEQSWPFCVFGVCDQDRCHCLRSYAGQNCAVYYKRCWLMYCFLTSCHPSQQSIYCKCDPSLYGQYVLTGEYWYDEGKRDVFEPPPSGWQDDLTESPHENIASMYYGNDQSGGIEREDMTEWNKPKYKASRPKTQNGGISQEQEPNAWGNQMNTNDGNGKISQNPEPDAWNLDKPKEPQKTEPGEISQHQKPAHKISSMGENDKTQNTKKDPQKSHPASKIEGAQNEEDTGEDLKAALKEVEEEGLESVATVGGFQIYLILAMSIFLMFWSNIRQ